MPCRPHADHSLARLQPVCHGWVDTSTSQKSAASICGCRKHAFLALSLDCVSILAQHKSVHSAPGESETPHDGLRSGVLREVREALLGSGLVGLSKDTVPKKASSLFSTSRSTMLCATSLATQPQPLVHSRPLLQSTRVLKRVYDTP